MKYFQHQLESLSPCYPQWDDVLRRYFELTYGSNDKDDLNDEVKVSLQVHDIIETILKLFTEYGDVKDTWNFPARSDALPFGQQATIRSTKMEVEFGFGIYHNDFFLQSNIKPPFYIKNMDDEFWSYFVALKSLGQFEFLGNAYPSSDDADKAIKDLKNTKSNIFQLIRNYILLELYEGKTEDIGSLEIKWPVTTAWDSVIKNGVFAFSRMYRINYMLYRAEYLHKKSKK